MIKNSREGRVANGLTDGIRAAKMQTANYMSDCCMQDDVIEDVVKNLDCLFQIFHGEVREIPANGMYIGGVNTAYVENYIMGFCETKRKHLELLQKEMIPMDVIRLIVGKGAPRDCREEMLEVIIKKSWNQLDKDFILKVGDQEDFPLMLQAQLNTF